MPIYLGLKGAQKRYLEEIGCRINGGDVVKPTGKFWKRYFNKRVRKGAIHKRDNWIELY